MNSLIEWNDSDERSYRDIRQLTAAVLHHLDAQRRRSQLRGRAPVIPSPISEDSHPGPERRRHYTSYKGAKADLRRWIAQTKAKHAEHSPAALSRRDLFDEIDTGDDKSALDCICTDSPVPNPGSPLCTNERSWR